VYGTQPGPTAHGLLPDVDPMPYLLFHPYSGSLPSPNNLGRTDGQALAVALVFLNSTQSCPESGDVPQRQSPVLTIYFNGHTIKLLQILKFVISLSVFFFYIRLSIENNAMNTLW
jgi:hypothetical protein